MNNENGFTRRAFIIGSLLCLLIALTEPYFQGVVSGSRLSFDFYTGYAILLLFILTFLVNSILKSISKNLGLSFQELITVYVMMIVACPIVSLGLTFRLLPIIAAPFYYATPENRWAELIHPHIRSWLVPRDPQVLKYFYEGAPRGTGVPWGAWIGPLFYWSIFILALYFVMICMMSILRKQWVEKEKLTFPLAKLPLEMAKDEPGSIIPPLFKNKLMWVGFIITFGMGILTGLHHYFHFFPAISMYATSIPIFRNTVAVPFWISFPMIGFAYLVPTSVSLSMWVFCLLSYIERGWANMVGFSLREIVDPYTAGMGDFISHQGIGAIITLVIMGLWIARKHLKDVFLKAIGKGKNIDDSKELLSYPVSFWGMVIGLVFMGIWLNLSGMPGVVVPIFLFIAFIFFLGVSRMIAEGGTALVQSPGISSFFITSGFGTSILGPVGLTSLAFTWIYSADNRIFLMGSVANGLKISEEKKKMHPLFWAMTLAIVIAMVGSIWMGLTLIYKYGGINMQQWLFTRQPRYGFDLAVAKMLNPGGPSLGGWLFTGLGAGIMFLLTLLYHRFTWWPLHPIGFPIGCTEMVVRVWFSVFLAWVVKTAALRYGGPKFYKNLQPLFFGLIIGQFAVIGLWLVIDSIAGGFGNILFYY